MWCFPTGTQNILSHFCEKKSQICQTKPLSCFVFPSPSLSLRSFPRGAFAVSGSARCEGGMCGGKGAKACTTNSAHERLMQQEQLSSIVSLQISSVPHFASQCVSSKRPREGRTERKQTKIGRGGKKTSEAKRKPNIKTFIALTRRRLSSVSSI